MPPAPPPPAAQPLAAFQPRAPPPLPAPPPPSPNLFGTVGRSVTHWSPLSIAVVGGSPLLVILLFFVVCYCRRLRRLRVPPPPPPKPKSLQEAEAAWQDLELRPATAAATSAHLQRVAVTIARSSGGALGAAAALWEERTDPTSGRPYFWDRVSGRVSWTRPAALKASGPAAPLPPGWREITCENGTYFNNETTGESRWSRPTPAKPWLPLLR